MRETVRRRRQREGPGEVDRRGLAPPLAGSEEDAAKWVTNFGVH